jgi:peptidoglycan/xylan/chitin deacetylase (PgdA/CDA1 family)
MTSSFTDRGAALVGRAAGSIASMMGGSRLSILIFHRVLTEPDALFPGEIDARRFDRLMSLVAGSFCVLPLDRAIAQLSNGELPSRALSITFDDGYADNHDIALPILRRYGLSATFFLATGFLSGGRMWNDTVIECLRRTTSLKLDLRDFGLPEVAASSNGDRRAAIDILLPQIKYKTPSQREPLLRTLHRLCGEPQLPEKPMMDAEQVRALRRTGMVIGAHTVNHPILCSLTDLEAEREIADGRADLEAVLDEPVSLFAYPNGRLGPDYDERHAKMVERLGFSAAVSTEMGVSRVGDNTYQLRRFTPWDRAPWRWHARLLAHHVRG